MRLWTPQLCFALLISWPTYGQIHQLIPSDSGLVVHTPANWLSHETFPATTYILSDSVVVVTARQYYMLWQYMAYLAKSQKPPKKSWELAYVASIITWLAMEGLADARVYETDKHSLSSFATGDLYYLGLRVGSGAMVPISLYHWRPPNTGRFARRTIGALLVGSAAWDIAFSLERYNDPFAPLAGWTVLSNGRQIGFSREQIITFDLLRIVAGVYLIVKR